VLVAALAASLLLLMMVASPARAADTTFSPTGSEHTFVVPDGVSSVHVVATGAPGAVGYKGGSAGRGAQVSGDLTVDPGQTLYVNVGGAPTGLAPGADCYPLSPCIGGFNGGGGAGRYGGGGGGASDVREISSAEAGSLASRLIVAGGGGGSAYGEDIDCPGVRGGSGGDAGSDGGDGPMCRTVPGGTGGKAGGANAGGAGGSPGGGNGSLGLGGNGGGQDGGGGGGGLFGGGGGANFNTGFVASDLVSAPGGGGGGGSSLDPDGGPTPTIASGGPSVTISYTGPNTAPTAEDDSASTDEDTALNDIDVLTNDTDVDGDSLSVSSVTQPSHGSASLVNGKVNYTPAANYNGPDSFTYTASDGKGGTDTATVNLTVNAVNDAPVAEDDTKTTAEDTPLTFPSSDLVTNDDEGAANESGQTLTVTEVFDGTHGTVDLGTDANITFTPEANFNGEATFTYRVCDNGSPSECSIETATVNVTVSAVNDAPVAEDQSVTTNEDTAKEVTLGAPDVEGDNLSYTIVSGPAHGTLTGSGANQTYTPNNNYNGTDSFTFKANDGTDDSNTATVNITVNAVNDVPVANKDSYTMTDGERSISVPASSGVLANDTDAQEGDTLTVKLLRGPQVGTLKLRADGSFVYKMPKRTYERNEFNGVAFVYEVSDGAGETDRAKVTINKVQ
jgi:hypothetical protein